MSQEHVLVSGLGGQPQAVTFVLDELLRRGIAVSRVVVIHPHPEQQAADRVHSSLVRLEGEFGPGKTYSACELVAREVSDGGNGVIEGELGTHFPQVQRMIHRLLQELKQEGWHVHLAMSAGRRVFAIASLLIAPLLFDEEDHIYHLFTPQEIRVAADGGRIMHVPPEAGVRLDTYGFIPWSMFFPGLTRTLLSAEEMQRAIIEHMRGVEGAKCRQVIGHLTPRQRSILRAYASGMIPEEIEQQFGIANATLRSHTQHILAECRVAWGRDPQSHLDYHFIQEAFRFYGEIS